MDTQMKLQTNRIRDLRSRRGWSQEQLAAASGLSLRTIQRVENENRASRETVLSLAATFDIAFGELQADESPADAPAPFRINRPLLVCGGLALAISLLCYLLSIESALLLFPNAITIAVLMYLLFGWYFSGATLPSGAARRAVQAASIYIVCFALFSLAGGFGAGMLLVAALSGLIFGAIHYGFSLGGAARGG